jgi:hypothetical protein
VPLASLTLLTKKIVDREFDQVFRMWNALNQLRELLRAAVTTR